VAAFCEHNKDISWSIKHNECIIYLCYHHPLNKKPAASSSFTVNGLTSVEAKFRHDDADLSDFVGTGKFLVS